MQILCIETPLQENFYPPEKLAIDLERPLNDLLEEAIKDVLKKYMKKAKE